MRCPLFLGVFAGCALLNAQRLFPVFSQPAESGTVEAVAVAPAPGGDLYVAGNRYAPGSPAGSESLPSDAFITRLAPDGRIVWTVWLSGSKADQVNALATDPAGNVYAAGQTQSEDFPVRNAFLDKKCGQSAQVYCGWVARLDPSGGLSYSTYFGTSATARFNAIAADAAGSAYVTGYTTASDFPVTPGAFMTRRGASGGLSTYSFVAKLSPAGNSLAYSTYLGGATARCSGGSACVGVAGQTSGNAIRVDAEGNAYVAGSTSAIDFPVTAGAYQTECKCSRSAGDGFIAKLNPSGSALVFATYLGGSTFGIGGPGVNFQGHESISSLAVDAAGNVYAAGTTESNDFPVTEGAAQSSFLGCMNVSCSERTRVGFLSRLSADGRSLLSSTYAPGGAAVINAVTLDGDGAVWATGTNAGYYPPGIPRPLILPTVDGYVLGDNYVMRVSAELDQIPNETRMPNGVAGGSIAVDPAGFVLVSGFQNGLVTRFEQRSAAAPAVFGAGNSIAPVVSGRISPGELLTLYGANIGPRLPAEGRLDGKGRFASTLNGAKVYVNGVEAPLLYVSREQINLIAPFGLPQQHKIPVEIMVDGQVVTSLWLTLCNAEPEFFADLTGHALAYNQDGSRNSAARPARPGEVVTFWAAGAGDMEPRPADGELVSGDTTHPKLPVFLSAGGVPAEILYAGAAPTLVAGLLVVNARLPLELNALYGDEQTVLLRVGDWAGAPRRVFVKRD